MRADHERVPRLQGVLLPPADACRAAWAGAYHYPLCRHSLVGGGGVAAGGAGAVDGRLDAGDGGVFAAAPGVAQALVGDRDEVGICAGKRERQYGGGGGGGGGAFGSARSCLECRRTKGLGCRFVALT